jgi:hypothetical protein
MAERVDAGAPPADRLRDAEHVLRRLGYARVAPGSGARELEASFWVQEAGVPRRTFPVIVPPDDRAELSARIDRWLEAARSARGRSPRAIFVTPSDTLADVAWEHLARRAAGSLDHEVSILVMPGRSHGEEAAHFQLRTASPREVLRIATGVVAGLFRRAQGADGTGQIDFEEMLRLLRERFGLDVQRSLNVRSDEDALFVLYQLAQRDSYAPGDAGSSLHLLVLKPTGPAGRVPWFAA